MTKKPHYNHIRVTLTLVPPPPKTWTTPTYHLERYTIRRNIKTVHVQLHGLRGNEKRTESISFPLLPQVSDAELVRAAVFCSPHKWTVPFGMNVKQFNGKFTSPLSEHLLAALMGRLQAAPQHFSPRVLPPEYATPTVATVPVSQPYYQPPFPQPGQFQQFATTNTAQFPLASKKPTIVQWYKTRTPGIKVSLGCGTLIAALVLCIFASTAFGNGASQSTTTAPPSPTSQNQVAQLIPTDTPTPIVTTAPSPTPTSTRQPTATPTPRPTPTPKPTQPPIKPTPTPIRCQGVNGNPWCYDFSPGKYITYPPSSFCSYFIWGLMIQETAMSCNAVIVRIASQEANKARVLLMEVFRVLCIRINMQLLS